jgi:pimeloyl-ACP methyl ester carboxylesterase
MSREAAGGYLESFVSRDLSAVVRGLAVPVLTLCGEEDAVIGAEWIRSALSLLCPRLTVESVPGALAVRINRRLDAGTEKT